MVGGGERIGRFKGVGGEKQGGGKNSDGHQTGQNEHDHRQFLDRIVGKERNAVAMDFMLKGRADPRRTGGGAKRGNRNPGPTHTEEVETDETKEQ